MNFFSRSKKKSESEKTVETKSVTTEQKHLTHSSSTTTFTTVQHQTSQMFQTHSTTSIRQISSGSQGSLNSYTVKGSSDSNLQKYGNKDFNQKFKPPQLLSSASTDATPFNRDYQKYKSTPPRSAFTSTPLTTSAANRPINLNYQSPYAENGSRFRSASNPSTNVNAPTSSTNTVPIINQVRSPSQIQTDDNKLVVNVTKSSKFYDDPLAKVPTYITRSKHRGKLLLINNTKFLNNEKLKRDGAELDEDNLVKLFSQMGFEIVRSPNLDKKKMESKIISFRNDKTLKKVDIGAVIIMSHGNGKESSDSTEVVCTDEEVLKTSWIVNQFEGSLCPHLLGKPKIFIFQCCRGDNQDVVVVHDSKQTPLPRKVADMLIAYSTIPGFVSHRNPQTGTWYIQTVCKVFMEHAHDTDVESLLKIVDSELSNFVTPVGSRQTSSFENRGFKTCYLHPQLHQL